ncbi:acetyl-CoA C-acetyltransferase [Micromonospora inositola]|uniref:Acetyl-CoA C-acetyltransferase n=1 Tax=Micromonospora inositola TaxID=47865 RepID=A0A1C5JN79_9ACTN|nr:acetyl-CoA C-acetyltransferase [Micromonospora inositola]SCG71968.1 acetyl-CoA C-acetyltransferase [Micromonospora inositola]
MPEAVIVATARSPIGRANKGSLKDFRPDDLAARMVGAALDQVPELERSDVDDLMLGCAQPAGEAGYNMARVVAVLSGLDTVPGVTVNRYCSSSLQTTRMALHAIRAGEGDVFISAGVETVSRYGHGRADGMPGSRNPVFEAASDRSVRRAAGEGGEWIDPRDAGTLPDIYITMGNTAENVAQRLGMSREEQDQFAVRSQNLAEHAITEGFWAKDITPVQLADGSWVSADDGPRAGTTLEVVSALPPAFQENGTVTAGNSCPLNDGAAAVVVMSEQKAADLGIAPLARILSTAVTALSPEIMGLGPVEAVPAALRPLGMTIDDVDLFEINEAFAVQAWGSARELGIPIERLNVNGGAIAVGHPFGMTGARITSTLVNGLRHHDKEVGVETMCVGGGQGMAMVVQRLA